MSCLDVGLRAPPELHGGWGLTLEPAALAAVRIVVSAGSSTTGVDMTRLTGSLGSRLVCMVLLPARRQPGRSAPAPGNAR
jgi:hypothetical protein